MRLWWQQQLRRVNAGAASDEWHGWVLAALAFAAILYSLLVIGLHTDGLAT